MNCDCDYICERDAVEEQHYYNCNTKQQRSPGGRIPLKNKYLEDLKVDYLYHLALDTTMDLEKDFGDVKFVCLGGTAERMKKFAMYMAPILNLPMSEDLSEKGHRYAMYKVGPVLSVSHGIGIPSMVTAIQEVLKLLYYAKAKDPIFIRIGTCGGLAVPAGSVVVSSGGLNGLLEKSYDLPVLGKMRSFPAILDKRLAEELQYLNKDVEGFKTVIALTMGTDDFFRGQARQDGPFCDYTAEDRLAFLRKLEALGVRNIEMEAPAFAGMTAEAGVRSAIVCVTMLDRLQGDQVSLTRNTKDDWQERPMLVVSNLIKKYLTK